MVWDLGSRSRMYILFLLPYMHLHYNIPKPLRLDKAARFKLQMLNIGALIIGIGFWGPLYYIVLIRNPQNSIGNY